MGTGASRSKLDPRFDARVVEAAQELFLRAAIRPEGDVLRPLHDRALDFQRPQTWPFFDALFTPSAPMWQTAPARATVAAAPKQAAADGKASAAGPSPAVSPLTPEHVDAVRVVEWYVTAGRLEPTVRNTILPRSGKSVADERELEVQTLQSLFETLLRVLCSLPHDYADGGGGTLSRFPARPYADGSCDALMLACPDPLHDAWPFAMNRNGKVLGKVLYNLMGLCAAYRCTAAVQALLRIEPNPPLWHTRISADPPLSRSGIAAPLYWYVTRGTFDDNGDECVRVCEALLERMTLRGLRALHAGIDDGPASSATLLHAVVARACQGPGTTTRTGTSLKARPVVVALARKMLAASVTDDGTGVDVLATELQLVARYGANDPPPVTSAQYAAQYSARTSVRGHLLATVEFLTRSLAAAPTAAQLEALSPNAIVSDELPDPAVAIFGAAAAAGGPYESWAMATSGDDVRRTSLRERHTRTTFARRAALDLLQPLLADVEARDTAVHAYPARVAALALQAAFGPGVAAGLAPVAAIVRDCVAEPLPSDVAFPPPRAPDTVVAAGAGPKPAAAAAL